MRLKKMSLKNFRTYGEVEVDFSSINKALIVGMNYENPSDSNGSGKSNLFKGIGWIGWGESDAETIDLNIKNGEEVCEGTLEFEHDGKEVSITRTRTRKNGASTLDFKINGVVSNGSSVNDTNKKIVEFLRLDYNTFINSVYLRQDDIYSIANARTPSEGRELIENVLSLSDYDVCFEEAKSKVKDLESSIAIIDSFLESNSNTQNLIKETSKEIGSLNESLLQKKAEAKLSIKQLEEKNKELSALISIKSKFDALVSSKSSIEKDIESINQRINTTKKRISDGIEKDQKEIDSLKKVVSQKEERQQDSNRFEQRVANSISLQEEQRNIKKSIDELQQEKDSQTKEKAKYDKFVIEISTKGKSISSEIESIKLKIDNPSIGPGTKCDTCLSEITQNTLEHYVKHLNEKIEKKRDDLKSLKEEFTKVSKIQKEISEKIDLLTASITKNNNRLNEISNDILRDDYVVNQRNFYKLRIEEVNESIGKLKELESGDRYKTQKDEISSFENELLSKQSSLKQVIDDIGKSQNVEIDSIKQEVSNLQIKTDNLKRDYYSIENNIKNKQSDLQKFDTITLEIADKTKKKEQMSEDKTTYEELVGAFSQKGIRAHILENAIRELEQESNKLLSSLSLGRLSVNFVTKKETKTKGEKVVFQVHISDGEKTLPFNMWSGGERFRISFVLRVALSKLLLKRANSKLEFLIIDEAVSPLDDSGVENIMGIINDLQNEFKTILVITHRNDVKKYFDNVITIFRDKNGSKII
jgi:exonuclease SbcC